jgi:hypothetical protein
VILDGLKTHRSRLVKDLEYLAAYASHSRQRLPTEDHRLKTAEDPMKLILNLKILVGLGRFLPLGCDVLQNHFVRYITATRYKVPSCPQMSPPRLPTQVRK